MDKFLKIFPFMPNKSETKKFIIALLMYFFVFPIALTAICSICGVTLILAPLAAIVGGVGGLWTLLGLIFSILCFAGVISK